MNLTPEPKSTFEAYNGPDSDQWWKADQEELKALESQKTWVMVKLSEVPRGTQILTSKCVRRRKFNADGTVSRYKSRICARGFMEREGIDYNEVFAPVVKFTSLRTLLSIATAMGWEIHQVDVDTAFLYAPLEELIYMFLPDGMEQYDENGELLVCQLLKSIYGLKQSPRNWNQYIHDWLVKHGFHQSANDPGIYIHVESGALLALYVDDLVIAAKDIEVIRQFKKDFSATFKIKDLGELAWCLGMEFTRDRQQGTSTLSQRKYTYDVLDQYRMLDCNPVGVPYDETRRVNNNVKLEVDMSKIFRSMVGSLMYLAVATRPDIAFSVNQLARVMSAPDEFHWESAKKVLRYLKGTMNIGITFSGGINNDNVLVGYSDSDWGSCPVTRKSTTGYVLMLNGGAISWNSKLQTTVAISTMEAEYMAMCATMQEGVFLRQLLKDMNFEQTDPTDIKEDNTGTISLAKKPVITNRSKHIDIKFHFVREKVEERVFCTPHVGTGDMVADALTKAIKKLAFVRFRDIMMNILNSHK
jgi:hypothetical protein